MENSKSKQIENLGVNKMGKNIKKIHLHRLNYVSISQQSEPPVYNITKEEFKDFVQHMTGSPNHPPHQPPNSTPKPTITRLQKFRPPPLSLVRPAVPVSPRVPISFQIPAPVSILEAPKAPPPGIVDFPGIFDGSKETSQAAIPLQPSTGTPQPSTISLPWDMSSGNMVESPITACVRRLLEDPDSNGDQFQVQPTTQQVPSIVQPQPPQLQPHPQQSRLQPQFQSQHHPLSFILDRNPSEKVLHPPSSNVIAPLVSENVTTTNPIVSVNASNSVQLETNVTTTNSLMAVKVNVNAASSSRMPVNFCNGNQLEPNGISSSLFSIDIPFPSPLSPPLFPPDFEPQSPRGQLLPPDILPTVSSSSFFSMSPSGFLPMSPWRPGQI